MRKFYQLTFDTELATASSVDRYHMGDFDLTSLWGGQKIPCKLPDQVKLFITGSIESLPDFVGNPLSWLLVSRRFRDLIAKELENCCQFLDAPLYANSGNDYIKNFYLLNVLSVVDCVDKENSQIEYLNDGEIDFIVDLHINYDLIPDCIDIFRVKNSIGSVIISNKIVDLIRGKGLTGVALIPI